MLDKASPDSFIRFVLEIFAQIRGEKSMGVLDFIAAGYLAKRAHNVANKPHVTVPDGIEILSLKAKGMNEYVIKYRTKGSSTRSQMTISRSTRSMSGGWEFHWD